MEKFWKFLRPTSKLGVKNFSKEVYFNSHEEIIWAASPSEQSLSLAHTEFPFSKKVDKVVIMKQINSSIYLNPLSLPRKNKVELGLYVLNKHNTFMLLFNKILNSNKTLLNIYEKDWKNLDLFKASA
ncbi:MAG: hypothetical protein GY817_01585 [bacterium]|nr:hypothetical protein [bacterium]